MLRLHISSKFYGMCQLVVISDYLQQQNKILNDKSEQLEFNSVAKKTTKEEYTFRKRSSMNDNHNQTEYKVMIQAFKNDFNKMESCSHLL